MTRQQLLVTMAVMAGLAVAALDATVVATAMPTIVGELGGLGRYGWIFSSYLLTATTTIPLFSKLADMRGRKPIFLMGIGLFVGGSVLCGLSQTMVQLILFRALQGLGAGALQPVALTIVGDLFPPVQRARVQAFFSSVWGVSAVIGPALGGLLTDTVGWRWVFYVNVPVGALAVWLLVRNLHEERERGHHRLDWLGSLTLSGAIAVVLIAFIEMGPRRGWSSLEFVASLLGGAALFASFIFAERKATEPLVDLELLRRPLIATSLSLQAIAGVLIFACQSYVPPMVQGVHGRTATAAGAAVATMSIGWPIASVLTGRWLTRSTSRPPIILGTVFLLAGSSLLTLTGEVTSLWLVIVGSSIIGLGLGCVNTAIIVTVQSSVAWGQRGVVTGFVQFSRTVGGAVGVGLLGGVLAASTGPGVSPILDPVQRRLLPPAELQSRAADLASGLTIIYVLLAAVAAIGLLVAWKRAPAVDISAL